LGPAPSAGLEVPWCFWSDIRAVFDPEARLPSPARPLSRVHQGRGRHPGSAVH
jgi:hypothetical protein